MNISKIIGPLLTIETWARHVEPTQRAVYALLQEIAEKQLFTRADNTVSQRIDAELQRYDWPAAKPWPCTVVIVTHDNAEVGFPSGFKDWLNRLPEGREPLPEAERAFADRMRRRRGG